MSKKHALIMIGLLLDCFRRSSSRFVIQGSSEQCVYHSDVPALPTVSPVDDGYDEPWRA